MNHKQLMLRDGAPAALFLTAVQRAKAWQGVPFRAMPLFQAAPKDESDETKAFRVHEEERRRLKSLEGIARMKLRIASRAIDFSKVRWDARRNKFVPLEGINGTHTGISESRMATERARELPVPKMRGDRVNECAGQSAPRLPGETRLTKDNAEAVARLNDVWKDGYEKLRGTGRIVMTVGNVLKGLVKKGGEVKWQ